MTKIKDFKKIAEESQKKCVAIDKQIAECNAEIDELRKQMDDAVAVEDVKAYVDAGNKLKELELHVDAVVAIRGKLARGYTDDDVLAEMDKVLQDRDKEVAPMLADIKKKKSELLKLMVKVAKASAARSAVRDELVTAFNYGKEGKEAKMGKVKLQSIGNVVGWTTDTGWFFKDELRELGVDYNGVDRREVNELFNGFDNGVL